MKPEHYQLDIVVQFYPGKSVCHGGLGWRTIVLLRRCGGDRDLDRLDVGIVAPAAEHAAGVGA